MPCGSNSLGEHVDKCVFIPNVRIPIIGNEEEHAYSIKHINLLLCVVCDADARLIKGPNLNRIIKNFASPPAQKNTLAMDKTREHESLQPFLKEVKI